MKRLILVRHGETKADRGNIWHGTLDGPLTAHGQAQIEATARRLQQIHAEMPIDHIYMSPLGRTRRTAQAIADAIGVVPQIDDGLREMSIGEWEGRTIHQLRDEHQLWERWQADPTFTPPGGESPHSFSQRVPLPFTSFLESHPGKVVAAVTHGGVISSLLAQWFGEGPRDWTRWDPANCAVTILDRAGDGWTIYCVNDTGHLAEIRAAEGDTK